MVYHVVHITKSKHGYNKIVQYVLHVGTSKINLKLQLLGHSYLSISHKSTVDCFYNSFAKRKMAAPVDAVVEALVADIANPLDGEVCFLCASSNGAECVWNEIGDDITSHGRADALISYQGVDGNEFHKACRYACYRHYIFTVSRWTQGMGQIRIPACVEASIRHAFPGDGVFVGFQNNPEN